MKHLLLILGVIVLVGCGAGGDVSSSDTKSKEKQIEDATAKLNGSMENRGQNSDQ